MRKVAATTVATAVATTAAAARTGGRRRAALCAVLIVLCAAAAARAETALVMFEQDGCEWCERWNEEVGVVYGKTAEGRRAPLVRTDIHDAAPDGVELTSRPAFTPTFVLIDDGREVGRIEGYPGEDFFWGLLNRLLRRLPGEVSKAPRT